MARIRSDRRVGQLAFYNGNRLRLVQAFGPEVIADRDDFQSLPVDDTTGDPTEWDLTVVEVGAGTSTMAQTSLSGGGVVLTTAANENDGLNAQKKGSTYSLATGNELHGRIRLGAISDVDQTDLFAGLAVTDTDILGGVTDRIGIESLDGATQLSFVCEKDGTQTLVDIGDLADATPIEVEFYFRAGRVFVLVNGTLTTTITTNIPDDVLMRKSLQFLSGEANANTAVIDTFDVTQLGRN